MKEAGRVFSLADYFISHEVEGLGLGAQMTWRVGSAIIEPFYSNYMKYYVAQRRSAARRERATREGIQLAKKQERKQIILYERRNAKAA